MPRLFVLMVLAAIGACQHPSAASSGNGSAESPGSSMPRVANADVMVGDRDASVVAAVAGSSARSAADSGNSARASQPADAAVSGNDDDAGPRSGVDTPGTELLAFPGAVGFGRHASGGRGGATYHVTSLADSGAGTFRDAVSRPHRIIVFDVGGYVRLSSAVSVASDLSIEGQTAPGGGIGIMAREVSFSGSSNVIVRGLRFRQGDLDSDKKKSGINLLNTSGMIFDHISVEFAQWNNIDSVGAKNITVQYSIDADPIGQQFAAHTETGPYTWYRNLFANAHNRCPLAKADTQYINNVVYDFQAGYTAGDSSGHFHHDIIANYFIAGPRTTDSKNAFFQLGNQAVFARDNFIDSDRDGKLGGSMLAVGAGASALSSAWSSDSANISALDAAQAFAEVVAHAGALPHDPVDAKVIADVQSLGKDGDLWTHQGDTGLDNQGYGTLDSGTIAADSDADGMPDAWESKYGLDPHRAADGGGDFDHTGYTNLEKYCNSLIDGQYP